MGITPLCRVFCLTIIDIGGNISLGLLVIMGYAYKKTALLKRDSYQFALQAVANDGIAKKGQGESILSTE